MTIVLETVVTSISEQVEGEGHAICMQWPVKMKGSPNIYIINKPVQVLNWVKQQRNVIRL
jgi:hypothetical protein